LKCETGWQGIPAGICTFVYLDMELPQLFLKTGLPELLALTTGG